MSIPAVEAHRGRTRRTVDAAFWRQIKRTVAGVPVPQRQIDLIVDAVLAQLQLRGDDVVCDIACGNGALSQYLFDHCAALTGSDIDEEMIATARAHFAAPPAFEFVCLDAARYVAEEPRPQRFTKALCYGSFAYFPDADARCVLRTLHRRFPNVQRVVVGNLPDRDRAARFYPAGRDFVDELDRHDAPIGIWRSAGDWHALAESTGWRANIHHMPKEFYAAHYRFDVVLER